MNLKKKFLIKVENTMDNKRIYGNKIDIDTCKTMELYNKRAENIQNMKNIYTSVLLGDQNPDYANEWNELEKKLILPFFKLNEKSNVWDLGCGIGRWGEVLLPICNHYIGIDFSEGMVKIACDRCLTYLSDNKKFVQNTVQRFLSEDRTEDKPNIIIVSYVCMYINDFELVEVIKKIAEYAGEDCVIYFIDTVAIEKRLTLNEIYSSALKSDYSALYRTIDEYNEFFKPLENVGFKRKSSGFMPKLNNEHQYSETDRYYTVFERIK